MAIKVKATRNGLYPALIMREPDDVFHVDKEDHFHASWMVKVGAPAEQTAADQKGSAASAAPKAKTKGAKATKAAEKAAPQPPEEEADEAEPSGEQDGSESVI
jgi:hypothetical protein